MLFNNSQLRYTNMTLTYRQRHVLHAVVISPVCTVLHLCVVKCFVFVFFVLCYSEVLSVYLKNKSIKWNKSLFSVSQWRLIRTRIIVRLDQLNFLPRLSELYTAIADWLNSKPLLSDWPVMPVGGTIMIQLQRTQNALEIQMGRG